MMYMDKQAYKAGFLMALAVNGWTPETFGAAVKQAFSPLSILDAPAAVLTAIPLAIGAGSAYARTRLFDQPAAEEKLISYNPATQDLVNELKLAAHRIRKQRAAKNEAITPV